MHITKCSALFFVLFHIRYCFTIIILFVILCVKHTHLLCFFSLCFIVCSGVEAAAAAVVVVVYDIRILKCMIVSTLHYTHVNVRVCLCCVCNTKFIISFRGRKIIFMNWNLFVMWLCVNTINCSNQNYSTQMRMLFYKFKWNKYRRTVFALSFDCWFVFLYPIFFSFLWMKSEIVVVYAHFNFYSLCWSSAFSSILNWFSIFSFVVFVFLFVISADSTIVFVILYFVLTTRNKKIFVLQFSEWERQKK